MCDYSLMEFNNRLAVEGEVLVTHHFPSGSIGLISEAQAATPPMQSGGCHVDRNGYCAVCVPHGTKLALVVDEAAEMVEKHRRNWNAWFPAWMREILSGSPPEPAPEPVVRVVKEGVLIQVGLDSGSHRDAIRFRDVTLLLQQITPGHRFRVGAVVAEPVEQQQQPAAVVPAGV